MLGTVPHPTTDTDQGRPSDAVADRSGERTRPASGPGGSARTADRHGPPPDNESPPETNAERSATVSGRQRPVRSWPLLVLAAPAAVAVWSGWVGIGQMTGFGEIRPLPGIWNSLHVDTAVTLPIGVEAYAAFALHVWLTSNPAVSDRTRRFARWSAIVALVLGMAGQVAYHLLAQAGVIRAPWEATTLVSCLPVLVLGMGSALAHMLRSDTSADGAPVHFPASLTSRKDGNGQHPADQSLFDRPVPADVASVLPEPGFSALRDQHGDGRGAGKLVSYPGYGVRVRPPARTRVPDAYSAAARVIASGQQISRRSLRSAGLHSSNADLGMLARLVRASPHGPTASLNK